MSKISLSPASAWIYNQYLELNQGLEDKLEIYEISHAVDMIYNFLWNKYANWYVEYLKIDDSEIDFAKEVYKQFVILISPYMPFEAEAIWREIFEETSDLNYQKKDLEFLQKYQANSADVQEFKSLIALIEELRSMRGLFGIDPAMKMEIYLNSDTLQKYASYIELVGRASLSYSFENKNYQVENPDFSFKLNILDFIVDKDEEIRKTNNEIQTLEKQIKSLQAQLSNQAFVSKAPDQVIAEKKNSLLARELDLQTQNNKLQILAS